MRYLLSWTYSAGLQVKPIFEAMGNRLGCLGIIARHPASFKAKFWSAAYPPATAGGTDCIQVSSWILEAKPERRAWIQSVPPAVAGGYAVGSPCALADLLGAEAADSVETEGKNDAVLFSQTNVKARKLRRRRTAIPRMPERYRRAD